MVLWFYVQEHPKAQPTVVLVLKRLRRRGNSLKSHPTDWEKPGYFFHQILTAHAIEVTKFQISM